MNYAIQFVFGIFPVCRDINASKSIHYQAVNLVLLINKNNINSISIVYHVIYTYL